MKKPAADALGLLEHMKKFQLQTRPELSAPDPAAYELPAGTPVGEAMPVELDAGPVWRVSRVKD